MENALNEWLLTHSIGKKERTQQFHREIVSIIKSNLGRLDISPSQLTQDDLTLFAQKVAHYCPSRWNAIVSAMRQICDKPKLWTYKKLRFRHFKPPTQEEFQSLLIECDSAPRSHCGLVVRLLSLTGLRIAEARQLRWSHIGSEELHLPGDITKNGQPRAVPLLPGSREIISRLKSIAGDRAFVLPVANTRTALRKACQRAGLKPWTYHDFRHLFVVRCIEASVDIPTVSRWVGHSDGGALLSKMYFHLASPHSRRMAERVRICV